MASIDSGSKPYQGPDDEEFVFDIALDPRSDASESEEDETSQNMQCTGGAVLRKVQREPSAFDDDSNIEKDASSDSDLTELSNSPELTDEDELAEEASNALCEMDKDPFKIPAHADTEMADEGEYEALDTTSDAQVGQHTEADDSAELFADQDSAPMSEKLLTSQIRGAEDDALPACPQHSAEVEQEMVVSRNEPFEYETAEGVSIADPPEEPHSPGRQATPVPSAAAYEVAPPAANPTTPPRTPSPPRSASSSEPRFAFKPFAAFSTPSPERLRVAKRRRLPGSRLRHPSLTGILVSRNAGSARRTSKVVSWLLPGDFEAETTTPSEKADGRQTDRNVPSSPPPRTPLAELPTASNEKFAKHFSSVVKRTDGLRHRFHVTADTDRVVVDRGLHTITSSQNANLTAKNTADVAMEDVTAAADKSDEAENRDRPREASLSLEPMDMVEDMVREMGDFWQAWDVDAELSAAKKLQAEAATSGT
ncbi:hypothetical protein MY5147_006873 [Beauveria neobassiana]